MRSISRFLLRLMTVMFLVALGTFVLLSFSPIDPIQAYIGNDLLHVPPQQYAQIAARWGLDQPLWLRFGHWILQLLQGDLGFSMLYNTPVIQVIGERFATSALLLILAWLLCGLFGISLGILAAGYLTKWPDRLICSFCYLLSALPTFWIAMLLLALFAVKVPLLPVCCAWDPGNDAANAGWLEQGRHLILPVLSLSLLGMGTIALHTREKFAEQMNTAFVQFARAQGETRWSLIRVHLLRHAITPALCLQFASLGELLGGSLLTEKVFAYPGLGQATIDAGLRGDIPLLMGIILFTTLLVFCGNTISATLVWRIQRPLERP